MMLVSVSTSLLLSPCCVEIDENGGSILASQLSYYKFRPYGCVHQHGDRTPSWVEQMSSEQLVVETAWLVKNQ